MDEAALIERLGKIEALYAGTPYDGERAAAGAARDRIKALLEEMRAKESPIEAKFRMQDGWSRRLFLAILRRYDIQPYRYKGQRHTTLMIRAPKEFIENTLCPELNEFSQTLQEYLSEVTDRVISDVLGQQPSDGIEEQPDNAQITDGEDTW